MKIITKACAAYLIVQSSLDGMTAAASRRALAGVPSYVLKYGQY